MLKGIFILVTNLYLNCSEFTLYSQQMCKHVMWGKNKPWQLQLNKHFVLQGGFQISYPHPDLVVSYPECGVIERKSIVVVCLWNLALFFCLNVVPGAQSRSSNCFICSYLNTCFLLHLVEK